MGKEKLHHPHPNDIELDKVLIALADPIRRKILSRIAFNGPHFCGALEEDIAKSTMSHHFKTLREAGLTHTEIVGKYRRVYRRDSAVESVFPGLLEAVGLPSGNGQWEEE